MVIINTHTLRVTANDLRRENMPSIAKMLDDAANEIDVLMEKIDVLMENKEPIRSTEER